MAKSILSIEEIKKRYPELFELSEGKMLDEIKLASYVYYNSQNTIMSDERFDSMEMVFKQRFPNNKEIYNVGTDLNETDNKIKGFGKHKHTRLPGVTQIKAQNIAELIEKLRLKNITSENFVITEKLDGISLYAIYNAKTGILEKVVTRGTGEIGDDITKNAQKINGIQSHIDTTEYLKEFPDAETIEIRGEGLILNENFQKLNKLYESEGKKLKNARNAAAGIVRRLDGKYLEYLDFMPYEEIIELDNSVIVQRDEIIKMEQLDKLGFNTPYWAVINNIEEMKNEYEKYNQTERKNLRGADKGYEIDGLVFKVNSNEIQQNLGMSDNRQNGQVALKFPPEMALTKIIDIEWSESYNGIITPVAVVEPTNIGGMEVIDEKGVPKIVGGVTIERISLANEDVMNNILLSIGDTIEISRRNDVIPKIEKNLKLEEMYVNFHKFIHSSLFPEIDKNILELPENNKLREVLLDFKESIEMDLTTDIFNIEAKINDIIRSSLFKEGEFLENSFKKDKQIVSQIVREFTASYKKDLNKLADKFEKKLSKDEEVKLNINNLFDKIKETSKSIVDEIDNKESTMKNCNQNNIEFIKNCPTCGSGLVSDNSNIICNNSGCQNLLKGKLGIFITKNKDLIVASELNAVDSFLKETPTDKLSIDKYKEDLNIEIISLEAKRIWEQYEKDGDLKKLSNKLLEEAKKAGIGEAKLSDIYDKGIAVTIKEMFSIKEDDFIIGKDDKNKNIYYEGWGARSVSNLIKDINKLRDLTDVQLLTGLNFKQMSESRFLKLLQNVSFKDLLENKIPREDLLKLDNFGEIIIDSLLNDFETKKEEILGLLEVIKIKETPVISLSADEKLTVVMTGSVIPKDQNNPSKDWLALEEQVKSSGFKMDRSGLTKYLKSLGHTVSGSVTGNTNYLINIDATSTSSKNKKAKQLGVEIIAPEDIYQKMNKSYEPEKKIDEIEGPSI